MRGRRPRPARPIPPPVLRTLLSTADVADSSEPSETPDSSRPDVIPINAVPEALPSDYLLVTRDRLEAVLRAALHIQVALADAGLAGPLVEEPRDREPRSVREILSNAGFYPDSQNPDVISIKGALRARQGGLGSMMSRLIDHLNVMLSA